MQVDNISIKPRLISLDLKNVNSFYKDFNDYRLWISLSQQKMGGDETDTAGLEAAIDYLRNGIRQIPFNYALLYNYGVVNERLGKLNVAKKFF